MVNQRKMRTSNFYKKKGQPPFLPEKWESLQKNCLSPFLFEGEDEAVLVSGAVVACVFEVYGGFHKSCFEQVV